METCTVNNGNNLLRGTLWLPSGRDAVGPFPAVVIRSPYGAQDQNADWGNIVLAERGYAVLLQDTRGRFGSDGNFVPVEHEREDGKETVRWVRAQPWCDGRIAVFGPSYLGLPACATFFWSAAAFDALRGGDRLAAAGHSIIGLEEGLIRWC